MNELGVMIGKIATGEADDAAPDDGKDAGAVARGSKGGMKGGRVRAERLSPETRHQIAKAAAQARWSKGRPERPE